jgi:hypothetical protein
LRFSATRSQPITYRQSAKSRATARLRPIFARRASCCRFSSPTVRTDRLGLDGSEAYDVEELAQRLQPGGRLPCRPVGADGSCEEIELICRIDTSYELDQFRHGGILPFMMRRLMEIA